MGASEHRSFGRYIAACIFVMTALGHAQTTQCRMTSVPIPDDGLSLVPPVPATDIMNIAGGGQIISLTVDVVINHTWVGDLVIELEHVTTGTRVILMERPGLATRIGCCGCQEDNINCTFDDMGARGAVENVCDVGALAISGDVVPFQPLAGFIGEDIGGDWRLDVFDGAGLDTGNLVSWCMNYMAGGAPCVINNLPPSPASGDISFDVDVMSMAMPPDVTLTLEWSPAGMGMFLPCTMSGSSPNPNPVVMQPAGNFAFVWDSAADMVGGTAPQMVDLRISSTDSTGTAICAATFEIDNRIFCTVVSPVMGTIVGPVDLNVTETTMAMPPNVTVTVEWSTAGAMSFAPCTMTGSSPNPNPLVMVTAGMHTFQWNPAADGAGIGGAENIDIRVTAIDSVGMATCSTTVSVDNSVPPSLCTTFCGDCNLDGVGPAITDALTAAQISAGLIVPGMAQMGCCDVNSAGGITITDALGIAQMAAGLPVTLMCP